MSPVPDDDFTRDFLALHNQSMVILRIPRIPLWEIAATIQLACRNPDFKGHPRATAEAFARDIFAAIATTPALKRIAEEGWDPRNDVPIKEYHHP